MFVPISFFPDFIETFLIGPSGNTFQLFLKLNFILVDHREGTTHIVLRVCIEVLSIILDHFAHRLLLHLPDILLLVAIRMNFKTIRHIKPRF